METMLADFRGTSHIDIGEEMEWKITRWDLLVVSVLVFGLSLAMSPIPSGRCVNDTVSVQKISN